MLRPNILLLTLDTLRADMVGCYGYKSGITPHIDQLAASGVRFEQAITGGSWTQAAFPVLLTSTYASMYGGCLGPLASERPSPIEALSTHGYETVGFSTSPLLSRTYGYHRGFNHFQDLLPGESDPGLRRLKGGERLLRLKATHKLSAMLGRQMRPARLYVSAEDLTNCVCAWLKNVKAPFFAWLHYMDIHWPYHLEEKLNTPEEISQAWRDLSNLHRINRKGAKLTPTQRQRLIALYEQAVQYTDTQIGILLAQLQKLGMKDNTVVILVADHGEEFMERKHWGHFETNLYDEIIKVPLIIYVPGKDKGQIVQRQVRTLDIMPTVLELCGVSAPANLEGSSLTPLWTQREIEYEVAEAISECWRDDHHIVALRTETFKYIWDSHQKEHPQLFDLRSDPGERHNIWQQHRKEAEQFQSRVDQHLQYVAQTSPLVKPTEPELDAEVRLRLRDLGYVE